MTDTHAEKPSPIEADRLAAIALAKLQEIFARGWDQESDHVDADDVLCELISSFGYPEVKEAFDRIDRWYA